MKTIDQFNFAGKKALIRVDFNVPLDKDLHVTDDSRIRAAVPTILKILNDQGAVILMSHLGRPKEGPADKYSLRHILKKLAELLNKPVKFAPDCMGEETAALTESLLPGEVLLLENLRFYKEEEKGNEDFARKLAAYGDVYVNDAFGTAHRSHASTAVIAKFFPSAKMFGYVMANELNSINKVLHQSERPFTAIMGGAKVSDKILIIEQLMKKVDHLIIGGAMAYTFIKARGGKIGKSLCEEDKLDLANDMMRQARDLGIQIHLPVDTVTGDQFSNEANTGECNIMEIPDGWMGLDLGNQTITLFTGIIGQSKTILWNGPMGVFEMPKFETGTRKVAEAIVKATRNGAYSLIGGGDSAAAINKFKLADQVSYVSTGGGALLEYIEGKELPGIKMILD